ncbi:IS1380 family transposase [Streptomyces sp. NPDC055287]
MQAIGLRPRIQVSADGSGVVGHAGARLLADLADATGLTAAYSTALRPLRPRGTGHDHRRIATDLAVMLADGGEAIADLAVLRDQAGVFGSVASTRRPGGCSPTPMRGHCLLCARPAPRPGCRGTHWLVLDLDATLITCHSEKEQAAPTHKGGFGFHPLLCFLANTGEALFGRLRPGNAGANTAADHITVLDQALAQIPDAHRHGTDILIRTDSAGSAKAFLAHVRDVRKRGIRTYFSVGYAITEPVRRAVRAMPDRLWHPALDQDGTLRDGAEIAELTGMVDLDGYPAGTRIIVRRERPHPGAQLSLFDQDEGLRHQVFLTDTPSCSGASAQFLEVRHRGHATVEDHIRCGKTTGFGRFPSRDFDIKLSGSNSASRRSTYWPGPVSCCWTANLATAEPKKLRYRLLHVADRLTRGGRRLHLRISATFEPRHCRAEEAPLPATARRRPPHPRRPTPALAHIGDLALETRTGHGLPPPRRTAVFPYSKRVKTSQN